jgi:hypothetical protein
MRTSGARLVLGRAGVDSVGKLRSSQLGCVLQSFVRSTSSMSAYGLGRAELAHAMGRAGPRCFYRVKRQSLRIGFFGPPPPSTVLHPRSCPMDHPGREVCQHYWLSREGTCSSQYTSPDRPRGTGRDQRGVSLVKAPDIRRLWGGLTKLGGSVLSNSEAPQASLDSCR